MSGASKGARYARAHQKIKKNSRDQFCIWAIFLVLLSVHPLRSLAHNPRPARAPTSPHPSHHSPAHQPTAISISSPISNPKSLILSSLPGPCGSAAGAGRRGGAVGSAGAAGSSRRHDTHQRTTTASTAAVILLMTLITSTLHSSIPHPAYALVQPITKTGGLLTTELLSSGWAGFFAGCLHTLSGPDHLVALAPLSIGRSRLESGLVGALWGCGHDAGQVIFGLLFLLLKDRLHIEVLRTWGTRVVGLTLLIIGGMGIHEASEVHESSLALAGVDCNMSSSSEPLQTPAAPRKKVGFATFATGVVHGLQPDALLMVLPALALPSRLAGAAFLGMFLVGTVFSMGSYTAFVGSCSEALKERVPRITEKLTWAASLIAICMGIALLVGQFFGFSLY